MTVDLTDVSRQVRGSFNSGITTGYACSQVAYKCLTSPTDYPINDGSFRSLKAIVPPGPRGQRGAAGADALVDDLSDDHRRHRVQGARAGDPGSGHRRPSRRSGHRRHARHQYEDVGIFPCQFRPARRRLGRQAQRGRRLGDGVHQRRRHPQLAERTIRSEVSARGRALRAHCGFRRRRTLPRRARARTCGARARADDLQQPRRARPLQAVGAGGRRRGHRQRSGAYASAASGRPTSPTPKFWSRTWSRAMRSACARVAAAVTARRCNGRSTNVEADAKQGYISLKAARDSYGVVLDPETFAADVEATERLRASLRNALSNAAARQSARA